MTSTRLRPRPAGGYARCEERSRRPAGALSVQPTSALRIASMPDSTCATIGVTCSNEPLRAVFTSSAHARATESAPTMATLPCSECAARNSASRSPFAGGLADRFHLARAVAHQRIDELRDEPARAARFEAAQVPRDFAGGVRCVRACVYQLRLPSTVLAQPLERVAAESDELLCREIGRELFGQLQAYGAPSRARHFRTRGRRAQHRRDRGRDCRARSARAPANRPDRARGAATAALRRGAAGAPRSCRAADARAARDR